MPSTEIQYSNCVINYIQGSQYNYEFNDRENGPGHAFPGESKLYCRLNMSNRKYSQD